MMDGKSRSASDDAVKTSHSQNGEDVRVWRALKHVEAPLYVEVGANDPLELSVTAGLSANGWRGWLIEPDPDHAQRLRDARPLDVVIPAAAWNFNGVLPFFRVLGTGLSSVKRSFADEAEQRGFDVAPMHVPAVRLGDVFRDVATGSIHFLSIDVEGAESEVLEGAEIERWRPWVVCVESVHPGTASDTSHLWEKWMLDAKYLYVTTDGINRWYVAEEHAELCASIVVPYSVLDEALEHWVRAPSLGAAVERSATTGTSVDALEPLSRALVLALTQVDQLGRQLARATAEADSVQVEVRAAAERWAAERGDLLASTQVASTLLQGERDEALVELAQLRVEADALLREVSELMGGVASRDWQLAALSDIVAEYRHQVAGLQSDAEGRRVERAALLAEVEVLSSDATSARAARDAVKADLAEVLQNLAHVVALSEERYVETVTLRLALDAAIRESAERLEALQASSLELERMQELHLEIFRSRSWRLLQGPRRWRSRLKVQPGFESAQGGEPVRVDPIEDMRSLGPGPAAATAEPEIVRAIKHAQAVDPRRQALLSRDEL